MKKVRGSASTVERLSVLKKPGLRDVLNAEKDAQEMSVLGFPTEEQSLDCSSEQ